MPRYVAFLRGVSPMNAKNMELKRSFEGAGLTDVKTVLSSGNVVFNARAKSETALVRQAEAAMAKYLGRTFYTIVRPARVLQDLIEADPYATFHLPANAKRVVTFLREPKGEAFATAREGWRTHPRHERTRGLYRLRSESARTRIHDADREDFRC